MIDILLFVKLTQNAERRVQNEGSLRSEIIIYSILSLIYYLNDI